MATAKPRGRSFPKGQSGNPKGSSRKSKELGHIKRLTVEQVAEVGSLLLENNRRAMLELAQSEDKPFMQVWTASLMLKGYAQGSPQIYAAIMDRIIGRPKETKEITGANQGPIEFKSIEEKQLELKTLIEQSQLLGDD